ncbi:MULTISPECIES: flagellar biosynthesis anti-sigma factor FlgM [Allobacillus]|uniref:Negative regulator of flagellin synthesis n=1 Tax=Allobacillus salarius TaxID=1955272 RepID=A0A556PQZ4_9BACI|nr:flagellar biosynthesis anti-sigma factor FlgM [Allobacillus salarius]TSJ66806.1 flagellar biosynthesis anti-sigma factor FlgM [Allobacillus salarius]
MKINPLNNPKINAYKPQVQQQQQQTQSKNQATDKVQISEEAKQLQQSNPIVEARQEKVENLKQEVQKGTYQLDPKQTAEKMVEFWNGR